MRQNAAEIEGIEALLGLPGAVFQRLAEKMR